MKNALIIEPSVIKKLISEKFNVSEDKVIKTQYSYIVEQGNNENEVMNNEHNTETSA